MNDKEFADKLDAERRILAHGYTKAPCRLCHGTGYLLKGDGVVEVKAIIQIECFSCEGKGYEWKAPII